MAAIDSDEKFALACNWLIEQGQLPVTGERQVIPVERKVYDAVPNPNPPPGQLLTDVTPSQAVLEAALDSALAAIAQQQEIDQARAALAEIRQYLLRQLVSASPDSPTVQVATMKAIANGNTYLAQIMSNQLTAMNAAFGWSLTNNPTTNQTRLQYIVTIEILTGVLPQS